MNAAVIPRRLLYYTEIQRIIREGWPCAENGALVRVDTEYFPDSPRVLEEPADAPVLVHVSTSGCNLTGWLSVDDLRRTPEDLLAHLLEGWRSALRQRGVYRDWPETSGKQPQKLGPGH